MFDANVLSHFILLYIDPGSGSIIFQAVVAGAMTIGLTLKIYWRKFRAVFRGTRR